MSYWHRGKRGSHNVDIERSCVSPIMRRLQQVEMSAWCSLVALNAMKQRLQHTGQEKVRSLKANAKVEETSARNGAR